MTASEVPPLDAAQRDTVRRLAAAVARRDGAPPLSDAALAALGDAGSRHWLVPGGYAQRSGDSVEIAAEDAATAARLLDAVGTGAADGFLIWSHGTGSVLAPELERRGYERRRVLHRLQRPLTDLPPPRPLPDGVVIRPFRPGTDEDAWLRVNARAFATHPEQGGWTRADVAEREREPWFDPADLLLAWRGERLAGFHWTKRHDATTGEVYVLGVDPDAQGTGLGAALLDAGLAHLAARGRRVVLLYVDDDNRVALRLYERSGFGRADVDVQWALPA